jgi:mono/diheme cytochrome c family protein
MPSADISTRARRCSADDSRSLAKIAVQAVADSDQQAQQIFLHHCLTCHDNLAFMLARREILKLAKQLPPGWEVVSIQLERGDFPV